MVYGYRRRYAKSSRRGTLRVRTKKVAKASGKNIAKLQQQVSRLSRSLRKIPQKHIMTYKLINHNPARDYTAINLCNYTTANTTRATGDGYTWQPGANLAFGTTADDLETNRVFDRSLGIKMKFQCGAETDNITYSVFLVSLKDQANDGARFDPQNADLTLTAGQDYVFSPTDDGALGLCMVNKKIFNIHYHKTFTIGNNGTALTSPSAIGGIQAQKTIYIKKKLNHMITNPIGNVWQQCQTARDPSKQYYLLIFNDDSFLDVHAQRFDMTMVRTVSVYE